MNDDELKKLVKESIKQEEESLTKTVKHSIHEKITQTINAQSIPLNKARLQKNRKNKTSTKNDYLFIYIISSILFFLGIFFLWKKFSS